ncbi:hypothetical protein BSKO_01047 [Bryopsis sp. KO-2023]|nr:hypothetical protein BSKO_01047 [Bryopsis sp. KO-2023]
MCGNLWKMGARSLFCRGGEVRQNREEGGDRRGLRKVIATMFLLGDCFPGWHAVKRAMPWRRKDRRQKNRRRQKDKGPPNFNPIYDDHCWFDTPPSTPRPHPVSAMARAMGSFKQKSIRLARGAPAPSPNCSPLRTYTASTEGEVDACKDVDDTACSTLRTPKRPFQPACACRSMDSPPPKREAVGAENKNPNRLGTVLSPRHSVLSVIGEENEGKGLELSTPSSPAVRGIGDCYTVVDSSSHPLADREPFDERDAPDSVATAESVTLDGRSSEESELEPEGVLHDNPYKGTKLGFARQEAEEMGEPHWEADVLPASPWKSRNVILRI